MLTIVDLDAAFMEAEATVEQWEIEFLQQYNRPLLQADMIQRVLTMTLVDVGQFSRDNPAEFEQARKVIARLRKMRGNHG